MTRITRENIREAGGIVHSDGNIFLTNIDQLNAAIDWAAKRGEARACEVFSLGEWCLWPLDRYDEAKERGWQVRKLYTHPAPVNQEHGELVRRLRRNVEGWLDDKPEELITLAADALEGKL